MKKTNPNRHSDKNRASRPSFKKVHPESPNLRTPSRPILDVALVAAACPERSQGTVPSNVVLDYEFTVSDAFREWLGIFYERYLTVASTSVAVGLYGSPGASYSIEQYPLYPCFFSAANAFARSTCEALP